MEDGPSNSKTDAAAIVAELAARSGRQEEESSEGEDNDALLKAALSTHATSFHELGFREQDDSDSDEDDPVARFRRTFSQCDSPGDPVPEDALTAKNKDEKCSDHEKNLKQFLEDSSAWRKVMHRIQPTPCERVVKSDGEMVNIMNFCDEMTKVSSAFSKLSFERCSSAPPVCNSHTRRKQKWRIHKLFRGLFKFGNSSTQSRTDCAKDETKPSSVNTETKSSSNSNESEPRTSDIAATASSKYENESEESNILQKITSGTGNENSECLEIFRIVDSDKSKSLPENSPDTENSCGSGKSEASLVIDLGDSNSSKENSADTENICGSGKSEVFLAIDSTKSNSSTENIPVCNILTSCSLDKSETSQTDAVKSASSRENTPGTESSCSSEERHLKYARRSGPSTSGTESSCSSEERRLKDVRRSGPSTSGTESSCSSEVRRVKDARQSGLSISDTESSCSSEVRRVNDARQSGTSTSDTESSCISQKSDLPATFRKSDSKSNIGNTLVTETSWSSENSEVSRIIEAGPSVSPVEYYSSSVETSSSVSDNLSETCASVDTHKQNSPPLLTSRPPAPTPLVIKVPTKMPEPGTAYNSPKQVSESTLPSTNTRRPMDFNVKRRSAFYTFSPSSPTNFIIRPYRSLPNVYRSAGNLTTRRSACSDNSKRRAVRSLFTGNFNPDRSASNFGESASFSRISATKSQTAGGSTKQVPHSSSKEQTLPENSSKVMYPNPKACKKLTFTPTKETRVNPTFQNIFNVSSSGESAFSSKISSSQSQKAAGSIKQLPHSSCQGQTLPENSSKVTCPNPKACKKLSFTPTKQTNENPFQSIQDLSLKVLEDISKMSLYDVYQPPEDDVAREDTTPKRKVTSPIITECLNLPVKKARSSAEFDPTAARIDELDEAKENIPELPKPLGHGSRESVSPKRKVEDVPNPEVAFPGSPQSASKRTKSLLEPPDHGSRKSVSPKRKVEELYIQNPDVVPPDERSQEKSSESALKRTKIKPPTPVDESLCSDICLPKSDDKES